MKDTNRALVVGVSDYRAPLTKLPAVAADVREIAKVLQSRDGSFARSGTRVLTERRATKSAVLSELAEAFAAEDTAFVYLAGHGAVVQGAYYYVPHDADPKDLGRTGVPLAQIKDLFDGCKSQRAFLWLDCCHSGGILKARSAESDESVVKRTLEVVQGQGRVIIAACTAEQYAYENDTHGLFTGALLRGLKGEANEHGEVTATSLYGFIDRQIGSDLQRPMLFGQMTGRIVLMHYGDRSSAPTPKRKPKSKPTKPSSDSNFVMLGDDYVEAEAVRRDASGRFDVAISSRDAERDAMVQSLDPRKRFNEPIPFAHRNDACDVRVKGVSAEATAKGQLWSLTLEPVESNGSPLAFGSISEGGRKYEAEELAEMRARAILLDERPATPRRGMAGYSMVDSAVCRTDRGEPVPCPIRDAYARHKAKRSAWKEFARLRAVYWLKRTRTIEHVLELSIGRVNQGRVAVAFRGRCVRQYSNQEPTVIALSGDCPLEPT